MGLFEICYSMTFFLSIFAYGVNMICSKLDIDYKDLLNHVLVILSVFSIVLLDVHSLFVNFDILSCSGFD